MAGQGKRRGHGPAASPRKPSRVITVGGLRGLFTAIGRRIFNRMQKPEVEYGQTLTRKRRKNCILKSVSSLSCPTDDDGGFLIVPYHINFKFAKDETQRPYRGSGRHFDKLNRKESPCCDRCDCVQSKTETFSRFSISSDSACDVSSSSESSCDDLDCIYRKTPRRLKKRKSKSAGDVSRSQGRSVENFIRIHSQHFKRGGIDNPTCEPDAPETANHSYESLMNSLDETRTVLDDSDYDILLTKSGYRVAEPYYENLKVLESVHDVGCDPDQPFGDGLDRRKDKVQPHKTYDEVIQSLKLWHLNSRNTEDSQKVDNALNHCLEGYESLENDLNNDIEEFSC